MRTSTILLTCLLTIELTVASDWPRWRGPGNDGHSSAETGITSLPQQLDILWRQPVGEGFSSPVVSDGKLAIMDNEGGMEVLHLFNAATGEELWKVEIDEVFEDQQGPPGPRNTPVLDGGHVYAVSCRGEFQCRSITDGTLVWSVNYVDDLGAEFIGERGTAPGASRHGNNGSPLIDGPHIIAPVGGGDGHSVVCFDKRTGDVIWHSQNDQAGYGAPVLADIAGREQVMVFTVQGVIGLDRQNGELLWRVPMETAYGRHVITPVVWKDMVIAGSHQVGLVGIRISRDGESFSAEKAWQSDEAAPNFSHPVNHGQYLFTLGPDRNVLCVDMESGQVEWSKTGLITTSGGKAYSGFIVTGDNLLQLTDGGELILMEASPDDSEVLGRMQVCRPNWCNPALANGVLYVRDGIRGEGYLSAIRLR